MIFIIKMFYLNRATTLKERLKARRSRLQDTAGGISEDEPSPRKTDRTWVGYFK